MTKEEFQFISFDPVRDVDRWDFAEEWPTGTRKKTTLIEPGTGKHHILKYPKERREHQVWSEMLASYIAGDLLGWDVQHASIACCRGKLGNLLRYFYEPASETGNDREIFVEGWSLCREIDPEYDVRKGQRHTLPLILRVGAEYVEPSFGIEPECFFDFWARAFALDCLISNTDRHAENWAVIAGPRRARMAPLYDNGTSLGCSLDQVGLERAFDGDGNVSAAHLNRQRKNGRHHVRKAEECKRGSPFEEVSVEFLKIYPEGRRRFAEAAEADIGAVDELMDSIREQGDFKPCYCLSLDRQKHIYAMLQIGLERIRNILRGARR